MSATGACTCIKVIQDPGHNWRYMKWWGQQFNPAFSIISYVWYPNFQLLPVLIQSQQASFNYWLFFFQLLLNAISYFKITCLENGLWSILLKQMFLVLLFCTSLLLHGEEWSRVIPGLHVKPINFPEGGVHLSLRCSHFLSSFMFFHPHFSSWKKVQLYWISWIISFQNSCGLAPVYLNAVR